MLIECSNFRLAVYALRLSVVNLKSIFIIRTTQAILILDE